MFSTKPFIRTARSGTPWLWRVERTGAKGVQFTYLSARDGRRVALPLEY
jgi:hypothetical protein